MCDFISFKLRHYRNQKTSGYTIYTSPVLNSHHDIRKSTRITAEWTIEGVDGVSEDHLFIYGTNSEEEYRNVQSFINENYKNRDVFVKTMILKYLNMGALCNIFKYTKLEPKKVLDLMLEFIGSLEPVSDPIRYKIIRSKVMKSKEDNDRRLKNGYAGRPGHYDNLYPDFDSFLSNIGAETIALALQPLIKYIESINTD